MMVWEGRSLRRWEKSIKKRTQELQNGREKAGSKARLTSTAPFSMWSVADTHGQEWRKEAGRFRVFNQQERSKGPCPF